VARDPERRLRQHNGDLAGGARYTQARRPVELVWSEACDDRSTAQRHEARIKALSRRDKLRLIRRGPPAPPAD
jgi:putative endonuclease